MSEDDPIRVLVVDDQDLVRGGRSPRPQVRSAACALP